MEDGDAGRKILAEMWGPDFVERRRKSRNAFNAPVADLAEEVCFGRIWTRQGLSRRERSMITVAMLIALNRPAQLKSYVAGALTNGCSVDEIREILLHSAPYCGLPSAVDAFRVAEEVLVERKLLDQAS